MAHVPTNIGTRRSYRRAIAALIRFPSFDEVPTNRLPQEIQVSKYLCRGIVSSDFNIQNIVASADLGGELDLSILAMSLDGAEYDPETFPGLIYRLKEPKTATLLFRSGKAVCTGAKTMEGVEHAVGTVAANVRKAGVRIADPLRFEVQNIVASADLGQPIDLTSVVISIGLENVEYEPEVFPGLVYRLYDPKVVILLFGSGRLVCTGAKRPKDVEDAIKNLSEELRSADLM